MLKNPDKEFETYHFEVFVNLKHFIKQIDNFFKIKNFNISDFNLHPSLEEFLQKNNFLAAINEINKNTSQISSFRKRFFAWFDAFRIIKYINFTHEQYYSKISVKKAVIDLLENTNSVRFYMNDTKELVMQLRRIEHEVC